VKLGDKAESADQPDVVLARDSVAMYELQTDELVPADEVTEPGEFPEYGDFMETGKVKQSGETVDVWLEVPSALAKWLVENEIEIGDRFRIGAVRKADGRWEYTCYADV
jgi:hypothetical protein